MDIEKQIDYWRTSALEDLDAAQVLVKLGKNRHGLFLAHLALEKMLKAHICRVTGDIPPRIHRLTALADKAGLELTHRRSIFLGNFDLYQLEGRYPDPSAVPVPVAECQREMKKAEDVLKWLTERLLKP
jgi:HEPN domain-containing protein